jgi:predicted regulator of Ras-like GTPase activity (Roadblock/LC7/MglB family)
VGSSALTPAEALGRLGELSTDVGAAVILDASGSPAASEPDRPELGDRLAELAGVMLERAQEAGGDAAEVEVSTPEGSVFVVREGGWTAAVVAGRFALSSLMRYDIRRILHDLDGGAE